MRIYILIGLFASTAQADNWPEWRGADGDGFSDESTVPLKWTHQQNILWKTELPAPGNSSPIVFGDRVFLTSANDDGTERSLMAFDRNSGALLWKRSKRHLQSDPTHATNPWCAPSPATDGQSVYTWDGSAGAAAYDYSGKLLWRRDLGAFVHPRPSRMLVKDFSFGQGVVAMPRKVLRQGFKIFGTGGHLHILGISIDSRI